MMKAEELQRSSYSYEGHFADNIFESIMREISGITLHSHSRSIPSAIGPSATTFFGIFRNSEISNVVDN